MLTFAKKMVSCFFLVRIKKREIDSARDDKKKRSL